MPSSPLYTGDEHSLVLHLVSVNAQKIQLNRLSGYRSEMLQLSVVQIQLPIPTTSVITRCFRLEKLFLPGSIIRLIA
jgi:hypothetical protein